MDNLDTKYRESEDSELQDLPFLGGSKPTRFGKRVSLHSWLSWVAQSALFVISLIILIVAKTRRPTEAECTPILNPYSPAFEAIEYYEKNYPRDFGEPSPYRGTPSLEKDNLWQDLWDYGAINVPASRQAELNHTTPREGTTWRYTDPKFGGGPAALIWGYHQLHCVDVLRMASYRDFYQKRFEEEGVDMPFLFEGPEYLVRIHIDHCIEMLRIDFMCKADMTPFFIEMEESAPLGYRADFSVHQKCRNFEKLQKWTEEHIAIL